MFNPSFGPTAKRGIAVLILVFGVLGGMIMFKNAMAAKSETARWYDPTTWGLGSTALGGLLFLL
jgi:hypothetical protein